MNYKLVGHEVEKVDDVLEWAKWFETANRRVAEDVVNGYVVSTVFLGIDFGMWTVDPMLFETMVFPENSWSEVGRAHYSSWESAELGHRRFVEEIKHGAFVPKQSIG